MLNRCLRILTFFAFSSLISNGNAAAQEDLDTLDSWVRAMHPAPFIRCGEEAWMKRLKLTREQWPNASHIDRVQLTNLLLQTMQDSHSGVSGFHWIWDVEKKHGTLPIRWAIEGRGLWVLDSGLPGLPEEVRVLNINGLSAEDVVQAALNLSTMEGPSYKATSRTAAHNITPWILAKFDTSTVTITWIDEKQGKPITRSFHAQKWRQARKGWARISATRPVVDWTFPDGSKLTRLDERLHVKQNHRLAEAQKKRRIQTHWSGAATLKISSFSRGPWARYQKRLARGFQRVKDMNCPLILDLRGNPGGQSPRMEMLWNYVAKSARHLPFALVAKQSHPTSRANSRHYKRLRKRWVDKHLHHSADAKYIFTLATLPLGAIDTLFFPKKRVPQQSFKGPLAVLIDGESASASVSLAGALQDSKRGPLIGESCLGPKNGTMGNPYIRTLPKSGIQVSLSTAVYMAEPCTNWKETNPIKPDVLIPAMWKRNSELNESLRLWIDSQSKKP